ncbi:hypothetical protein LCGC14_0672820 [marine sediment metagenome]|uniref:Uncharacterized protein n=1 Tax=marine sediment metagenome TaxID=412755 RepID=A0A0F9RAR1_9ZZZZ
MTGREQKVSYALIKALKRLEFRAHKEHWIRLNPEEFIGQRGPAVLARHPEVVANEQHLLVAIVGVRDGAMVITYCIESYRRGIESAIKSAVKPPRNLGEP